MTASGLRREAARGGNKSRRWIRLMGCVNDALASGGCLRRMPEARPRWEDPEPSFALLSKMYRTDPPPVQWFGPPICDYDGGATADVSSGKTTGGVHR